MKKGNQLGKPEEAYGERTEWEQSIIRIFEEAMMKPTTLYTSQKINKIIKKNHAKTSIYDYAKKQTGLFFIPPVLKQCKL